jgi:hypothetical protein
MNPEGIPEAALMEKLDAVTPEDAAQLLRELEASGHLHVKALPGAPRGIKAPSLLLGPRGAARAGGGGDSCAEGTTAARHFWPALSSAFVVHDSLLPQGSVEPAV